MHGRICEWLVAQIPFSQQGFKPRKPRCRLQLASNDKYNSVFSIQVELLDDEEVSSKLGSEVDEKRGGEIGGGEVEGVVRLRSGVSEASDG